jgi:hypothetical protein
MTDLTLNPIAQLIAIIDEWLQKRDAKRYIELKRQYQEANAFYYDECPSKPNYFSKLEKDVI